MFWIVLSYSLPSSPRSSLRVALWRRLRRLGAVAPTGGLYILPARDECVEAFQWLAQEIRQAQGEVVVLRVEQFEGLNDAQLIELFHQARREDYQEIEVQLTALEHTVGAAQLEDKPHLQSSLDKLHRQYTDIARVDYFQSAEGTLIGARLAKVTRMLHTSSLTSIPAVSPVTIAAYQGKCWVTRPRPHVDRLACVWLIRRFINPTAVIRYSLQAEPDEITFDMSEAQFGHQGNLCTFETMVAAFGLTEPGLQPMAEIVHEIDLRDSHYTRPEISGVEAILKGWLLADLPDAELERHGVALFEGLYAMFSYHAS